MSWVPLHFHSQFSILDALPSVGAIAKKAKEFEIPAIALTDHGNMYGAVDFYLACQKEGVKPLIGCEVYVAPGSRHEKKRVPGQKTAHHLVLIAKTDEGYHNLCKLTSFGFTEGFYYNPRVDKELLQQYSKGLICLSGCMSGMVSDRARNGSPEELLDEVRWHRDLYGEDYYLEIQRHQMTQEQIEADGMFEESWLAQQYESFIGEQEKGNAAVIEVARAEGIPLVATNDTHYINREDWRAHEILLNVQSGEPCEIWERDSLGNPKHRVPNPKRRTYSSHELYFKSPEQMAELFSDVPDAIANTLAVADKVEFELDLKTKHYPRYKEKAAESEKLLRDLCEEAIPKRYTPDRLAVVAEHYPGKEPMDVVRDRLEMEMGIIKQKGMVDYLLIVWDFIDWAKKRGIPVGPGRGSGAGVIVNYLIGITDIEPLRFSLFFERFTNPERMSEPDIDVDICMERRGEVIDYVVEKYGKESVAQIITFGTMKAKMAIKDVGRVLSVPLSKVNQIAKLVPEDVGMTLDKALELDPDLVRMCDEDEETRRVIEMAKILEGSVRSTGIHAAGIIISSEPLSERMPICVAKDSEMAVTQYAMKPAEKVGMLKMDFLGLKTLTCIQKAILAIEERFGKSIDPLELPLDDKKAFALLNAGKTLGIFQMESGGMQDLARNLHIDKFEEIMAVGALYRPGPMDLIPSFIARKHGREAIEYDHPDMEESLKETYGIMVYQEQVQQIAQVLANFSLGQGDLLRRAMGKKIVEEMAEQREKFREGALARDIDEQTALTVFDKMEKFAGYGFNKSHAASYGFLTYITAYLKANYPGEWMAALMTCDRDDTTKIAKYIREARALQIPILPPDVNEAGDCFVATDQGIRFAMTGIKGVGHGVVEMILTERKANGPYEGLFDFLQRIDTKKANKKAIEALVGAGCFDFCGWTRDALFLSIEPMTGAAVKEQKDKQVGAMSLFSLMDEGEHTEFDKPPEVPVPSTENQRLFKEKELLGFFLTGHPMDGYRKTMDALCCVPLAEIESLDHHAVFRTAFIVDTVTIRFSSRSQKKFAILMISDGYDTYELPIWPDLYEEKGAFLMENQLLYAVLHVDRKEGYPRISCHWFDDLTQSDQGMMQACDTAFDKAKLQIARREAYIDKPKKKKVEEVKTVLLGVDADKVRLSEVLALKTIFRAHAGPASVVLDFRSKGGSVGKVAVDSQWGVEPSAKLKENLKKVACVVEVDQKG